MGLFFRFDYARNVFVKRQVKIAALCGEQQETEDTGGIPLWHHDVIVVTAGTTFA